MNYLPFSLRTYIIRNESMYLIRNKSKWQFESQCLKLFQTSMNAVACWLRDTVFGGMWPQFINAIVRHRHHCFKKSGKLLVLLQYIHNNLFSSNTMHKFLYKCRRYRSDVQIRSALTQISFSTNTSSSITSKNRSMIGLPNRKCSIIGALKTNDCMQTNGQNASI